VSTSRKRSILPLEVGEEFANPNPTYPRLNRLGDPATAHTHPGNIRFDHVGAAGISVTYFIEASTVPTADDPGPNTNRIPTAATHGVSSCFNQTEPGIC
jgi:hypothetical protein